MTDLYRRTASQLSADLAAGAITARALLDHYLARIERLNPRLNAFIAMAPDAAAQADAADQRRRSNRPLSALDGIPVAIKDNILVRGMPNVWGSKLFEDFVPDHDELPVAILRGAGAVILGKTNVPEFTMRGYTGNPVFGVTGNAWDPALTPGGSSGGSVSAVAAGLVPLTLGTDGGGSIRRPAAYAGLVGLKPSTARIPRGEGLPQVLFDCEIVGPIARTTGDVRFLLETIAIPHRADQRSRALPPLTPSNPSLRGLRILCVEQFGQSPVDPAITASFREATARLAALGHVVSHGALPFSIDAVANAWHKVGNVGLSLLARAHPDFYEKVSPAFAEQARAGAAISGGEYLEVLELLFKLRADVGQAFATIDVIATPACAAMPWPAATAFPATIDGRDAGPRGHAVFTGWVNACGHPGLTVPCTQGAMPIGMQLIGDMGAECLLLDLAAGYEAAHPWAQRWPELASSE